MNRYKIGDVVSIIDDDIIRGIINSIERVASNPRLAPFDSLDRYIETLDTFQYEIAYEFEGKVYKDTYYEKYIDLEG